MKEKTIGVLSMASGTVGHAKAMLRTHGVDAASDDGSDRRRRAGCGYLAKWVDIVCLHSQVAVLKTRGSSFAPSSQPPPASAGFVVHEDMLKTRRADIVKLCSRSRTVRRSRSIRSSRVWFAAYGKPTGDVESS
jgi:hypothetical protein